MEYMSQMTLRNIANACGGKYVGDDNLLDREISGAVIDSRLVEKDYLFIPIKGERVDGHKFIPQVFEKGALAVLSEQELDNPSGPYILVEKSELAMKQIARFYRSTFTIPVVGITGSVGKTSTKEMIASVLAEKYKVLKTAGNFNNEIGLPLTIFNVRPSHEVAVLEMGISDFDEMNRLTDMARPDICVITNIGYCHLENLGTRDGVLKAKTEMFNKMADGASIVLNGNDDKLVTKMSVDGKRPIFYGILPDDSIENSSSILPADGKLDIYADAIENLGFEGMLARVHINGAQTGDGQIVTADFDTKIEIPGQHNVMNALCATAVGLKLGLSPEQINSGIRKARTIAGRTNFIKTDSYTVIDDCYNANPVSMKSSIEVLSHAKGRSIAVLGDMGELGKDEKQLHFEVGQAVGLNKIDALFCTGELANEYVAGAMMAGKKEQIYHYENSAELIAALKDYVGDDDTILVKASHFMNFPEIVRELTE